MERENINMLEDCFFFFFSRCCYLFVFHLHYTPISLGWIKPAIKTSIHVCVKDTRHISSTHTMSNIPYRGGFLSHPYLPRSLFVVHIFTRARLRLRPCVYVCRRCSKTNAKRVSHSTLGTAHSDAWQMIRNGFLLTL